MAQAANPSGAIVLYQWTKKLFKMPFEFFSTAEQQILVKVSLDEAVGKHLERIRQVPIVIDADSGPHAVREDRKSTRLNSSHGSISYAVFCLKKKNADTST